MANTLNKSDLAWLTYNTEISNYSTSIDDCLSQEVVFRIYRPHHRDKLHQMFSDYKITDMKDQENNCYARINGFTISDMYRLIRENNGDMFLNLPDGKIYYVPVDKKKYRHIFNRASTKLLAHLPSAKKIKIIEALNQECFVSAGGKEKSEKALSKKTDKILALLNIRIPPKFLEDELRKVRLITAEISKLPNIKEYLEKFGKLPAKKQQDLLRKVCEITAKYNHINAPNIKFMTKKQIDKEAGLEDWVSAEAFAYENNVCINTDSIKKIGGVQALSLAWHETTHIAQAFGDYSQYPLVEEMFNHNFDFIQKMPETYIFHPQEKVVYALEKQFIEKIVENTGIKTNDDIFSYTPEYNITTQYLKRAINTKS